jgi:hypothetical protein
MKKGLLSLLALALTVVGCQNYDDQFDELTSQITSLQTAVDGLTGLTQSVSNLQSTVDGLSTVLTQHSTELDEISTALAALAASLDADVATTDLGIISSTLADIRAGLNELLQASSVINQNVVITNEATLEYAESLISTDADSPNVIVNGRVEVNYTTFTSSGTVLVDRINAVVGKIATVLGDGKGNANSGLKVTSSSSFNFANLAFVDDNYIIAGADMVDDELRTVTGNVTIAHGGTAVPLDYSQLSSIGGNVIIAAADAATATTINFAGVDITGTLDAGAGAGILTFGNAGTVSLGAAGFTYLVAPKATEITSTLTAAAASLQVSGTAATSILLNSLESVATTLTIDATDTTTFRANVLASVGGAIDATGGALHFTGLTSHGAADFDAAIAVDLTAMASPTATVDLNTSPAIIAPAMTEFGYAVTWEVPVINLPAVDVVTGGSIVSAAATNVTVKALDDFTQMPAATTHLTLASQNASVTVADTDAGNISNLTITKDSDVTAMVAFSTAADFASGTNTLTTVALTGVDSVTLEGDTVTDLTANSGLYIYLGAASGVVTATTTGEIIRFFSGSADLDAWVNTANVKDDPAITAGEEAVTVSIFNSNLTTVDLSSMNKVRVVDLGTTNANLESVVAPSTEILLTPGAEPSFDIHLSTTVTYTEATLASQDGVNDPVPFQEACLEAPGVSTWPAYITAVRATNETITVSIDFDGVVGIDNDGTATSYGGITAAFAADAANLDTTADGRGGASSTVSFTGVISNDDELAIISATACE